MRVCVLSESLYRWGCFLRFREVREAGGKRASEFFKDGRVKFGVGERSVMFSAFEDRECLSPSTDCGPCSRGFKFRELILMTIAKPTIIGPNRLDYFH